MSEIIEKAKAHFRERLSEDMRSVEVPEWGTVIHFRPINLRDQDRIYRYIAKGSLEALAETLIVRALDGDGNKLFRPVHKTEFMRAVDPDVITRVCQAMADAGPTVEEAEKN